jgi:hypothetical protein
LCGREHGYDLEHLFQENESEGIINISFACSLLIDNPLTNNINLQVQPSKQDIFINLNHILSCGVLK